MFEDYKDNLKIAQVYFELEDDDGFDELYGQLDAHIEELEAKQPSSDSSGWNPQSMDKSANSSSASAGVIFHDVDE